MTKRQIGFVPIGGIQRKETPYDYYLTKFTRIQIPGGMRELGILEEVERLDHGYSFSLNPGILYKNGVPKKMKTKTLVTSNGNAVSLMEMPMSLEDFIKESQPKKKQSGAINYHDYSK